MKQFQKPSYHVFLRKKDRQAFGVMLGEEMNLEEEFRYPVTSVSAIKFKET